MRYLLFMGDQFYPLGGWQDYAGAFPTLQTAHEAATKKSGDWWQVVDLRTLKLVAEGSR